MAAALALSGPAVSAPIYSIGIGSSGTRFALYFDTASPGLSAFANVSVYNAKATQLVLNFAITNDTAVSEAGPLTQASLMSMGSTLI